MNITDVPKLNKIKRDDLIKRDVFGRNILHVVLLTNNHEALRTLTKNPDFKQILQCTDFENGWNCLHYIIFHKRILCFKILIEYLQQVSIQNNLFAHNSPLMELLRCKDRCGNTPLHLIDNDFKDMLWIPEFIDEENGYQFTYRYKFLQSESDKEDENGAEDEAEEKAKMRSSEIHWNEKRGGSEIYVLGCNSNNQLGVGDSTDRSTPTMLLHDSFKSDIDGPISEVLKPPRYKQMVISKNHAVVLSKDGQLYSCGIGSRGRLGHGQSDLNNYFKFRKIDFFHDVFIKDLAISNNHSVVLTTDNQVYAWGLNSFNQLGVSNSLIKKAKSYLDNFFATPVLVTGDLRKNSGLLHGVKVSKIHSVVWTKNELYFWGLNVGQMGIFCTHGDIEVKLQDESVRGEIQASPKMVTLRDDIKCVSTSELCTCVVTTLNDIHVYYNYQHFKLPKIPIKGYSDKHFDLFKPRRITEAAIIKKIVTRGPEHSMILLSNGSVLSFSINVNDVKGTKYTSIWKAYDHDTVAIDIDISTDGSVVLCTRNGSVFIKSVVSNQRKSSMSGATLPIAVTKNKFKKIENVNKVVRVTCDPKFLSFGFIRDDVDLLRLSVSENDFLTDIETLSPVSDYDFCRKQKQLLESGNSDRSSYLTNFFYPSSLDIVDDDDEYDRESENKDSNKTCAVDKLCESYNIKHDPKVNKPIDKVKRYQKKSEDVLKNIIEDYNRLGEEFMDTVYSVDFEDNEKLFDAHVEFDQLKNVQIGFHKDIFKVRSPIFEKLLELNDPNETLVGDNNFKAIWDPKTQSLKILSSIHSLSLLLLLHSVYTGKKIDISQHYGSRHNLPQRLKLVADEYNSLCNLFQLRLHNLAIVDAFADLLSHEHGDVIMKLTDGELKVHSYILKARSAFFETILSDRWDGEVTEKVLDFSGLTIFQMTVVLRFLYGYCDLEVLNCFECKFSQKDDFINALLELIEISDELLLFDLKTIIQVAISDLIGLDNVIPLVVHSQYLSANMLFYNCCWYIYNNLEVLMFDTNFTGIPLDVLEKIEIEIKNLANCMLVDKPNISKNWVESNPQLLSEFILSVDSFNENFMSDRKGFSSFEPLLDNVFIELKKPREVVKKRKSRKSSTINTDIVNFRKEFRQERKQDIVQAEAIDDNDGFTLVGKKTKQKSPPPPPVQPPQLVIKEETTSRTIPVKPKDPVFSGVSPFSTWGSKPVVPQSPPETPNPISDIKGIIPPDPKPKTAKVKIGPVIKVSQKERKRLAAAAAASASAAKTNEAEDKQSKEQTNFAPWYTQSAGSSSSINDKVNDLPVLGSSSTGASAASTKPKKKSISTLRPPQNGKKSPSPISIPPSSSNTPSCMADAITPDSSFNSVYSTPSLAEVMILESLKLEQAKQQESERKTLIEIQQEQEFAKWWEEESKRVQQEMGMSSDTSNNNNNKKKNKKFDGKNTKKGSSPKPNGNSKPKSSTTKNGNGNGNGNNNKKYPNKAKQNVSTTI
ncbi:btb1 BTB/POZ domain-containing protein 1 [Candida maltosa Xu316]